MVTVRKSALCRKNKNIGVSQAFSLNPAWSQGNSIRIYETENVLVF